MGTLNKSGYTKLIDENVEWLEANTSRSLERDHIIHVLRWSIKALYPANGMTCWQDGSQVAPQEPSSQKQCRDIDCLDTSPHSAH